MGERELRDKYGGKLDKAINRAIRAETPNGNEALDTLARLSGPAAHSGWVDNAGSPTPEAAAYHKHQRSVVGPLIAKICNAYNITPDKPTKASTGKRGAKRSARPRRSSPRK